MRYHCHFPFQEDNRSAEVSCVRAELSPGTACSVIGDVPTVVLAVEESGSQSVSGNSFFILNQTGFLIGFLRSNIVCGNMKKDNERLLVILL